MGETLTFKVIVRTWPAGETAEHVNAQRYRLFTEGALVFYKYNHAQENDPRDVVCMYSAQQWLKVEPLGIAK